MEYLKGIKVKNKQKEFTYEGVSTDTLFGQHLFPTTGKRIVVTEGELDAASCYEAMSGWPMVSLPHGAASAKKDIQKQIPLFQGYEEIILFFDNDEPGSKAAEETAQSYLQERLKSHVWRHIKTHQKRYKLTTQRQLEKLYGMQNRIDQMELLMEETLLEIVTTPQAPFDHEYPFKGLNKKLQGIRYGELVTFTAGSGCGKTSIMRHIATDLLQKGESVGILELEASNRRTALGLMSTAVGKNLTIGEHDERELTSAFESSIANWNLYLFDGFGSFDPDVIYNRIEYLASGLECRVIFLDHLVYY